MFGAVLFAILLGVALLLWLFAPLTLAVLLVAAAFAYRRFTRDSEFWSSRGVPGPPLKFPFGHNSGKYVVSDIDEWLYYQQGGKRFCGYFEMLRPVLHVGDPDLIQAITIKDFEHFTDRRPVALSEKFKKGLFVLRGKEWKDMRSVMSPTFSASKLKAMHQLCLDNANNLSRYVSDDMEKNGRVDMRDAFGRFTMDNIASCGFGVSCDSFADNNTEFARQASTFFKPLSLYGGLRMMIMVSISERLAFMLPDPYERCADFFRNVVQKVVEHRENNASTRRDFLQLLLETKDKDGNRVLSMDAITVQSILFLIAGYDTTAAALTFAGYSLATSPECQRKVQQELDEVLQKHNGQLTYEAVSELTYMDRVLSEALRLYSPAIRIERECTKDYILPGTNINIPAGTLVQMPVFTIQRDADHYPDPLKFDPDRFLPEEREKRHPCTWFPFGSGPRNCIAMRFALFESKVALAVLLKDFTLEPGPDAPPPPMPINKFTLLSTPVDGAAYIRVVSKKDH